MCELNKKEAPKRNLNRSDTMKRSISYQIKRIILVADIACMFLALCGIVFFAFVDKDSFITLDFWDLSQILSVLFTVFITTISVLALILLYSALEQLALKRRKPKDKSKQE